jgi:predicted RNase H-like HicB family nuclease
LLYYPDFPEQQFITHGKTYSEAADNGRDALEGLITVLQNHSQSIPSPSAIPIFQT